MNYKLLLIILGGCLSCNYTENLNSKHEMKKYDKNEEGKYAYDLTMYPKDTDENIRHVIYLPKLEIKTPHKVELYIGLFMEIDCNHHFLFGKVETKNVVGWGFPYLEFQTNGNIGHTLKGCPDNSRRNEFVYFKNELIDYNSRLPIIIYTPKKYEVKYKLWTTNNQFIE